MRQTVRHQRGMQYRISSSRTGGLSWIRRPAAGRTAELIPAPAGRPCGRICTPSAAPAWEGITMNRRHFLMGTAIIAGNAVVRGVQSPNDTVRVGIAGLGGRGSAHVSAWAAMKNVQIAGLCDVDEAHVGEKMNALDAKGVS